MPTMKVNSSCLAAQCFMGLDVFGDGSGFIISEEGVSVNSNETLRWGVTSDSDDSAHPCDQHSNILLHVSEAKI